MIFIQYPACGTCQKAKKWLAEQVIEVEMRHIVEEQPTLDELIAWVAESDLPVKKFFNTSGVLYKELGLKDKLPTMTEAEQIVLLSSNGKLVKRPLLIADDFVLVGFKPEEWAKALK
ncbi:arsenate reductase family protein [Porphyromonas gulae]|uniref:arsenate reductase family protein n=1 Tax=Porphyromonas gulae TaxID=111105 RepID=UPI0026E9C95A|nr:arsenate reductase family protein [Porphyromonas gulae]